MASPKDRVLNVTNEGMKTSHVILGDGILGGACITSDGTSKSSFLHQHAGWRALPMH